MLEGPRFEPVKDLPLIFEVLAQGERNVARVVLHRAELLDASALINSTLEMRRMRTVRELHYLKQ